MANLARIRAKILWVALCFVVFLLCSKSISSVLASIEFYGARNYIEYWQETGRVQHEQEIERAQEFAERSLSLHNNFPLYSDTLSTVLQWKALNSDNNESAIRALEEAEQLNLRSTTLRPAWPVTWANLAYIKWLKQEFDKDFIRYINNASSFGPNTPEVHIVLANIGLSLSKTNLGVFLENKAMFQNHVLLGLKHSKSREAVAKTIEKYEAARLVCTWLSFTQDIEVKRIECSH
jgi:tetratricopeptide (TPR) repeat protein